MTEPLYRTQLLLTPAQHRTLRKLAAEQKRSISDLVREILNLHFDLLENQTLWARRKEVVLKLSDLRKTALKKRGTYRGDLLSVRPEAAEPEGDES